MIHDKTATIHDTPPRGIILPPMGAADASAVVQVNAGQSVACRGLRAPFLRTAASSRLHHPASFMFKSVCAVRFSCKVGLGSGAGGTRP
jgi:hypothetical protein